MRQAGRSERRTEAAGCNGLFPPCREERGPEVSLCFFSGVVRTKHSFSQRRAGGLSVTAPCTCRPWAAAYPAAPRAHLRLVFSSCGFCCISGTTALAAGCGGMGLAVASRWEMGPAPPFPVVPELSASGAAPVLSHTGRCRRSPRQTRPTVRHTCPCSAP